MASIGLTGNFAALSAPLGFGKQKSKPGKQNGSLKVNGPLLYFSGGDKI
jgi:hypothetical protein